MEWIEDLADFALLYAGAYLTVKIIFHHTYIKQPTQGGIYDAYSVQHPRSDAAVSTTANRAD